MKTILALIITLITFATSAQVFEYNNYCYGTKIDSCKQVICHATCHPAEGVILFFSHQIKIDSMSFYIYSIDTLESINKFVYYASFENTSRVDQPASIIRDDKNKIVTLITLEDKSRMVLNMDYYMWVLKD